MKQLTINDICANKHQGNEMSVLANSKAAVAKQGRRKLVLDFIEASSAYGVTSIEIANGLGLPLNAISGRISELKRAGYVIDTCRTRTIDNRSAAVLVTIENFKD